MRFADDKLAPRPLPNKPLRIVLVGAPDAVAIDVTGVYEVFAHAANKLRELGFGRCPGYSLQLLSPDSNDRILAKSGLVLLTDGPFYSLSGEVDTLLFCGGMTPWEPSPALCRWVNEWFPRVRRIGSVCTGAFALAAAGILDDKRVTTHWHFTEQLAKRYPKLTVDPEPIFIRDGKVSTSAGVTSGMDLALLMVEEDFGPNVALQIARALVLFLRRPGGQSQFSVLLKQQSAYSAFEDLHLWVSNNLEKVRGVEDLAARSSMSLRNFSRRFRRDSGISPAAFLEQIRVEAARRRLEESEESIENIARETGFGSVDSLRRAFERRMNITPRAYRQRFSNFRRRTESGSRLRRPPLGGTFRK